MKTTYKVLSASGFQGHAEGETFEAELDEKLEARAVGRGQLRVLKRPESKQPKKEEKADG